MTKHNDAYPEINSATELAEDAELLALALSRLEKGATTIPAADVYAALGIDSAELSPIAEEELA